MPTKHTVREGDCTSSLAHQYGLVEGTIWDDPANAALRSQREDMNILAPGDVVTIPDKRPKEESRPTGALHRFQRLGVPVRFRLQLMNVDQPRAGVKYKLRIDDRVTREGVTDADGVLDVPLPPGARAGLLTIEDAEYELHFGVLNPIVTERGVRQRLVNLGFLDRPDAPDQDLRAALEAFQAQHQLELSGAADEDTRQKLLDEHDRRQAAG